GNSECSACSNPNTPVIQKRTLPLLRCIHLIRDGIVDQPGNKLTLTLEADRNGEQRNAMEEIRGAVERIDDPAVRFVGADDLAALLHEEAIARACTRQLAKQD